MKEKKLQPISQKYKFLTEKEYREQLYVNKVHNVEELDKFLRNIQSSMTESGSYR